MEFVKALDKAQALGVTKEEFMNIWEKESKLKSKSDEGQVVPKNSSQVSQDKSGDQGSGFSHYTSHLQQMKDEFEQEIYLKLQRMLSQQMETQKRQLEQVRHGSDQAAEEFRHQFEVLCNHVSNTIEAQALSLKLHFMQELELLRQEFKKMIEDHSNKHEAEKTSVALWQNSEIDSLKGDNLLQNINGFSNVTGNQSSQEIQQESLNKEDENQSSQEIEQEILNKEDEIPLSVLDWHLEVEYDRWNADKVEVNFTSESKESQIIQIPLSESYKKGVTRSAHTEKANKINSVRSVCQTDWDDWDDRASCISGISLTSMNEESVEATGFYAQAISEQMKQSSALKSSSARPLDRSANGSLNDTAEKTKSKSTNVSSPLASVKPSRWEEFTVTNSDQFSASDEAHLSPYLHSDTKAWKSRLSIRFDTTKQLKVQVRISTGESEGSQTWPLKFAGTGLIFNKLSRRFTQIWQLQPTTCKRPCFGEFVIPVKICLATKRGSYSNITYQKLDSKGYTGDNKLIFQWTLKTI